MTEYFSGVSVRGHYLGPLGGSEAPPPHPASFSAKSKTDEINLKFGELKEAADALGAEAQGFIQACQEFTTNPVAISYTPPIFNAPVFRDAPDSTFSDATIQEGAAEVDAAPSVTINDNFSSSSGQTSPPNSSPNAPRLAPYKGTPSLTGTLDRIDTNPPTAPTNVSVSMTSGSPVDEPTINTTPIDTLSITLDSPDVYVSPLSPSGFSLEPLIEAVREYADQDADIPEYSPVVIADVFSTIGSLLSVHSFIAEVNNTTNNYMEQFETSTFTELEGVWDSIGQQVPYFTALPTWTGAEAERLRAKARVRSNAAKERWVSDSIELGFKLGEAAHAVGISIKENIQKAEIMWLKTKGEALIDSYNAMVDAYKGALALAEADMAVIQAEYLSDGSEASKYEVEADREEMQSALNRAKAQLFETKEQAKATDIVKTKAYLSREETKLRAFDIKAQANELKTQALQRDLVEYQKKLAIWYVEVLKAKAEFEQYGIKTEEVRTKNSAYADIVRAFGGDLKKAEGQMRVKALEIEADVAVYEREMAEKALGYARYDIENRTESLKDQAAGATYIISKMNETNEVSLETGKLDGNTMFNEMAVQYFKTASDSASRAAELTLQANETLAKAYYSAQEAAGKASASIQHGKYSRWSLSAAMQAEGSWRLADNSGTNYNDTRTVQVSVSEHESALG